MSTRLATRGDDRGVDPPVGARSFTVERERIERRLRSLQTILTSRPFVRILRRVRSRRELGHRDRAHCDLDRESVRIDGLEVDDHRRVE